MTKIFLKLTSWGISSFYFFFSFTLIFVIAYFFGYKLLSGGLIGNDSANSFTFIIWLDKFFPKIPLWFPLQGTGVSFVQGYQLYPHLFVVWLHYVTSLSLIQSFELVNFLAIPFAAVGLYLLTWEKFKNQTIALIASVFYLLSPFSWTWTAQAGFFAQAVSFIFFPIAFLFFDRFLNRLWNGKNSKALLIDFLLAVIFTSFTLLCHFSTFMSLFNLIFLYTVFYSIMKLLKKDGKTSLRSVLGLITVFTTVVFLVGFWFVQLYTYISQANWDGSNNVDATLFPKLDLNQFFSIPQPAFLHLSVWSFSMPNFIWILATLSVFITFFYSKRLFALSLVFLVSIYGSISNEIFIITAKYLSLLSSGFSPRVFWVVFQFLAPFFAAFTIWEICHMPFVLFSKIHKQVPYLITKLGFVAASILAILIAVFCIIQFRSVDMGTSEFAHYGPTALYPYLGVVKETDTYAAGLDLRDIWQKDVGFCYIERHKVGILQHQCRIIGSTTINCAYNVNRENVKLCEDTGYQFSWAGVLNQLQFKNWPKVTLGNTMDTASFISTDLNKMLPPSDNLRIDVSPLFGSLVKKINIARQDISLVGLYTYQLSLNHTFWAMEQGSFYSKDDAVYADPKQNAELGKWFGTNYVILSPTDPIQKFQDAKVWNIINKQSFVSAQLKNPETLVEVTTKPSILVIGNWKKNRAFEQVFRLATHGVLPYDKAYIVMGKPDIDDYTPQELAKFEGVILQAYSYHNKNNAWNMLSQYVKTGGNVFIDTGWQYTVPDYQMTNTPLLLPTESLSWEKLSINSGFTLEDSSFAGNFSVSQFAPLIYNNSSWGVSTSQSLKPWASPVLTYNGYPLVVKGQVGNGKIIWSGMNLFSHALDKNNKDEMLFISKLFDYLLAGKSVEQTSISLVRNWPDRVEIMINSEIPNNASFFFREAYTSNWQGYVRLADGKKDISIYRSGPGLMFAKLPQMKPGDKVILEYHLLPVQIAGYFLTWITIIGILLLIFDTAFNNNKWSISCLRFLKFAFVVSQKHIHHFKKVRNTWIGDEEDY